MTTLARLETLSTALAAFDRAPAEQQARMESRLFDAAMDCGMSYDEPCVSTWAAGCVTRFLMGAVQ